MALRLVPTLRRRAQAALDSGSALPAVVTDEVSIPEEARAAEPCLERRDVRRRCPGDRRRARPGGPARRPRGSLRAAPGAGARGAGLGAGPVRRVHVGGRRGAGRRRCAPADLRGGPRRSGRPGRPAATHRRALAGPVGRGPAEASDQATVLEVRTEDRPGVVYLVCAALARMDVAVRSAHVDTLGPQAVDVFYLQEAAAGSLGDQRAAEAAHAVRAALIHSGRLRSPVRPEWAPDVRLAPSRPHSPRGPSCSPLSDRLAETFKNLRGKGRLSDADVDATVREIRIALLEADVALPVVKEFVGGGAGARPRRRGQQGAEPGPAGRQDRQRGARRHPRRRDPAAALRQEPARPSSCWPACRARARRPSPAKLALWPAEQGKTPLLVACRPPAPQRRHPAAGRRRAGRRAGVRAGAGQRRRRPGRRLARRRSRRPSASCTTSSSSTPPAASASTPS